MIIECFKVGVQTDAAGNTREWSEADLQQIVDNYNNQSEHNAPVVIGHPNTDSPAYGWVKSLKYTDGILYAELDKVDSGFKQIVNQGRYSQVSIALYDDLLLRHIGFLGAIPPAVKGLQPVEFREQNIKHILFMEHNYMEIPQLIELILKFVDETFGTEAKAQVQSFIDEQMSIPKPEPKAPASPDNSQGSTNSEHSENKEIDKKFSEQQKQIEHLNKKLREAEFNEYFSESVREGILVPAQKRLLKELFEAMPEAHLTFNEGNKSSTKSFKDTFKQLISTFPKQVQFNEFATGITEPSNEELIINKVKKYQGV